ncbi:MAG TPA: zf-HC2 domain-containing protein [Candidatus Bathyarchaeia archaeon]|jgi:predicted anti-sigma-YlaC factor YlaD|nr:zf-HC2 domain-containing protein [Candidatus Bathyarchaeia archaeon]
MSEKHVHGGPECVALFAKLSEYMDGEVDPAVCAGIEDHMADCAPCRDFLESLRRAVAFIASTNAPKLPEDLKSEIVAAYERARRA